MCGRPVIRIRNGRRGQAGGETSSILSLIVVADAFIAVLTLARAPAFLLAAGIAAPLFW